METQTRPGSPQAVTRVQGTRAPPVGGGTTKMVSMMKELLKKEKAAIEALRSFEPADGYYLCYSGGKDSDAIKILATLAGVKFEAHHNLTTADAPETVYYIRSQKDIFIDRPKKSMWQLIPKKLMPPTRIVRYCCEELKEYGGTGKLRITGVRKAESTKRAKTADLVWIVGKERTTEKQAIESGVVFRKNKMGGMLLPTDDDESRRLVETCYRDRTVTINPIVDWIDTEVWEFLRHYGCASNPLYSCGFKRVGCIGCPMAGKARYTEFRLYPKYKEMYLRAFARMLKAREELGRSSPWQSAEEVFAWWMEEDANQISFF